LTQDEAVTQRAYNTLQRKRGKKRIPIPQAVLDFLLPRVEVVTYVDDEDNKLGECWLWTGSAMCDVPRAYLGKGDDGKGGRWSNVRPWVAQAMRSQPIPKKWLTVAECGRPLCVHPHCCTAMSRSSATHLWNERGTTSTAVRVRAAMRAGRLNSHMTPETVQQLRADREAMRAAGQVRNIYCVLGPRYGLTPMSAKNIALGRRWAPGQEVLAPSRPVASVFDLGRMA
jgi:hypothetical protein